MTTPTPSAGLVYQGRDNTGAAAIVDSTVDTSYMDGILRGIASDEIAKKAAQEKANERLREEMEEMQYDPLGQEPLDVEGEAMVMDAENYAVEALGQGKDPRDVTTPEGVEFMKRKKKALMNSAHAKGAVKYFDLVMKGAGDEDIDQEELAAWRKGYLDAAPKEGETMATAKKKYIDANPYVPSKPVGTYDFVSPLLPNIEREKTGRVSALNKNNVMTLLVGELATPQGYAKAKKLMKAKGLDVGKKDDVNDFLESQYKLIELDKPKQVSEGRSTKSSSSGGASGSKSKYTYSVTRSDHENMYQGGGNNAIRLDGKDGVAMTQRPITSTENGTPISINKDKNGKLWLEYLIKFEDGSVNNKLIPYDDVRNEIINMYGQDLGALLDGSAPSEDPASSGDAPGGETKEERIKKIKAEAAGKK
jgi:hypothetical protein